MDALTDRPTPLTPPDSPLSMPVQEFDGWTRPVTLPLSARTALSRVFVFSLTLLLSSYAIWEMHRVIGQGTGTTLQYVLLFLFGLTFVWIAFSGANALLGFLVTATRPETLPRDVDLTTRIAVAVPLHNEETQRVFSSIAQMADDLVRSAQASHFDWFVLSDTTESTIADQELRAIGHLRARFRDRIAIYYRRRENTEGRKAGNIANFIQRWGALYDFMIVLDADSYMSADAMIRLARAMQQHPAAGLIQTAPRLFNGKTVFARFQEFATAVYGPVLSRGLALWYGTEGNYWGHNAIIRVHAFAASCGLPQLSGRKPFGGEIMSHDFVEAALLRRAGFAVYNGRTLMAAAKKRPQLSVTTSRATGVGRKAIFNTAESCQHPVFIG